MILLVGIPCLFTLQLVTVGSIIHTGHLPRSALRPPLSAFLFLLKAIDSTKVLGNFDFGTTYLLVYKILLAHPSLIENYAGLKFSRPNPYGEIYTVEYIRMRPAA